MAEFHITLPTRGDRHRGDWHPDSHRPFHASVTDPRATGSFDHLAQVGRAAELAAFTGAVAPFDPEGEESLVVAAALLRQTRWLRLRAEFHPGIATPVYAAKISASLQRFSGDRLDWGLAVDLDPAVARAQGDFHEGADRYARAAEFLTVAKGVWREPGYTYRGRFYEVLAGGFDAPLAGRDFPRVHLSGTSPAALELSALHGDVHVFERGDDLEAGIAALPGLAYAIRLPVLAREDDEEAWADAARLGGFTGLVGSYEQVAEEIRAYAGRGVTIFQLDASPYIEETYRLGEHLLPLLAKEGAHVR
ncbi:LLM class flavin-dependent oxidoreductase [Nonomuraea sp. NPDC046570]|uniref:LLM class flavin-dependent oxidoreductase n=1 Tax=Nonomuraea sp. NPDC046570 TaxID=3155255 RepID=UPI0033C8C9F1